MKTLILLSALLLSSTALAQQGRDIGPRTQQVQPNPKPAVIKPKPKPPAPPPEEQPQPPQPVAEAQPTPAPQPYIVVPAPQVTITESPKDWLGWALFGLGTVFVFVMGVQTWLNRYGLQLSVNPKALFDDPDFRAHLRDAISSSQGTTTVSLELEKVRDLLNRIEGRTAPALTSKRGEA